MAKAKDLSGQKFGRLFVNSFHGSERSKSGVSVRYWRCVCDCGNISKVSAGALTSGNTQSCGCAKIEATKRHGMYNTRQYQIWEDMKRRCNNPNTKAYKNYGARGITYDPKWESFEGFWEDMSEGYSDNLTLERIDPNGDYYKNNCSWETKSNQSRNKTRMGTNISGVTGVRYCFNKKNQTGYFIAEAQFLDTCKSKWFSVKKYGEEKAFKLACEQRQLFVGELNELGANFSAHHGVAAKNKENK